MFEVKCDDCKLAIRHTHSQAESAAGGVCQPCKAKRLTAGKQVRIETSAERVDAGFNLPTKQERTTVYMGETPVFDIEFSYSTTEAEKAQALIVATAMAEMLNEQVGDNLLAADKRYQTTRAAGRTS